MCMRLPSNPLHTMRVAHLCIASPAMHICTAHLHDTAVCSACLRLPRRPERGDSSYLTAGALGLTRMHAHGFACPALHSCASYLYCTVLGILHSNSSAWHSLLDSLAPRFEGKGRRSAVVRVCSPG